MDSASWVKTESLSEEQEQELEVSSQDGEYCSNGVDRSRYYKGSRCNNLFQFQIPMRLRTLVERCYH